jgi:anti-sigma B factor antagonist
MRQLVSGPVPVVRVGGDLDLATAPELSDALRGAFPPSDPVPERIVIDLEALHFCDSSGLRALMEAVREIEGRGAETLLIVKPDGPLDRLLVLLGLRDVLNIADSLALRAWPSAESR